MSQNTLSCCGNCKTKAEINAPPFQSCGACKKTSYCCKECQKIDRPRHKSLCKSQREKPISSISSLGTPSVTPSIPTEDDCLIEIKKVISRGKDLNKIPDGMNNIILMMSFYGYGKCVNLLLQHGADPNYTMLAMMVVILMSQYY